MKIVKVLAVILTSAALVVGSMSCSSVDAQTTSKTTLATVSKGSLSVSVTGTGNLAYSASEDLAFEVSGYVTEVLVKEGQSVTKGLELAKLDTSEWVKQVKALEKALATAQRNLDIKQRALTKAQDQVAARENDIAQANRQVTARENDIAKAERQVEAKELAVRQADLDLQSAKDSLSDIAGIAVIQDEIDNANFLLKVARMLETGDLVGSYDLAYWAEQKTYAEDTLVQAQKDLADIVKGTSTKVSSDVTLQVQKAQLQVEQSQKQLEEANFAVDDAKGAVEDARLAKTDAENAVKDAEAAVADAEQAVKDARLDEADAEQAVKDAQANLDEAKALSPVITAPFDGFVPKINVAGGDEVQKGTVAMQIADPNQFEANILVSEKNIFNLKVGQSATVALDALSGLTFPAQITKIATLATTSQGVVNYQVTVKLTSTQPASKTGMTQGSQQSGTASGAQSPGTTNQAKPTTGTSGPAPTGTAGGASAAQAVSLKSGMSAVVTVVIQQKDNVLKVPSRAITRQGQDSTVQVVTANGTETRVVKTGMSDNSSTEITQGLSEGDQVVVKAATTSTTSPTSNSNQPQPPGGPGLGGILR